MLSGFSNFFSNFLSRTTGAQPAAAPSAANPAGNLQLLINAFSDPDLLINKERAQKKLESFMFLLSNSLVLHKGKSPRNQLKEAVLSEFPYRHSLENHQILKDLLTRIPQLNPILDSIYGTPQRDDPNKPLIELKEFLEPHYPQFTDLTLEAVKFENPTRQNLQELSVNESIAFFFSEDSILEIKKTSAGKFSIYFFSAQEDISQTIVDDKKQKTLTAIVIEDISAESIENDAFIEFCNLKKERDSFQHLEKFLGKTRSRGEKTGFLAYTSVEKSKSQPIKPLMRFLKHKCGSYKTYRQIKHLLWRGRLKELANDAQYLNPVVSGSLNVCLEKFIASTSKSLKEGFITDDMADESIDLVKKIREAIPQPRFQISLVNALIPPLTQQELQAFEPKQPLDPGFHIPPSAPYRYGAAFRPPALPEVPKSFEEVLNFFCICRTIQDSRLGSSIEKELIKRIKSLPIPEKKVDENRFWRCNDPNEIHNIIVAIHSVALSLDQSGSREISVFYHLLAIADTLRKQSNSSRLEKDLSFDMIDIEDGNALLLEASSEADIDYRKRVNAYFDLEGKKREDCFGYMSSYMLPGIRDHINYRGLNPVVFYLSSSLNETVLEKYLASEFKRAQEEPLSRGPVPPENLKAFLKDPRPYLEVCDKHLMYLFGLSRARAFKDSLRSPSHPIVMQKLLGKSFVSWFPCPKEIILTPKGRLSLKSFLSYEKTKDSAVDAIQSNTLSSTKQLLLSERKKFKDFHPFLFLGTDPKDVGFRILHDLFKTDPNTDHGRKLTEAFLDFLTKEDLYTCIKNPKFIEIAFDVLAKLYAYQKESRPYEATTYLFSLFEIAFLAKQKGQDISKVTKFFKGLHSSERPENLMLLKVLPGMNHILEDRNDQFLDIVRSNLFLSLSNVSSMKLAKKRVADFLLENRSVYDEYFSKGQGYSKESINYLLQDLFGLSQLDWRPPQSGNLTSVLSDAGSFNFLEGFSFPLDLQLKNLLTFYTKFSVPLSDFSYTGGGFSHRRLPIRTTVNGYDRQVIIEHEGESYPLFWTGHDYLPYDHLDLVNGREEYVAIAQLRYPNLLFIKKGLAGVDLVNGREIVQSRTNFTDESVERILVDGKDYIMRQDGYLCPLTLAHFDMFYSEDRSILLRSNQFNHTFERTRDGCLVSKEFPGYFLTTPSLTLFGENFCYLHLTNPELEKHKALLAIDGSFFTFDVDKDEVVAKTSTDAAAIALQYFTVGQFKKAFEYLQKSQQIGRYSQTLLEILTKIINFDSFISDGILCQMKAASMLFDDHFLHENLQQAQDKTAVAQLSAIKKVYDRYLACVKTKEMADLQLDQEQLYFRELGFNQQNLLSQTPLAIQTRSLEISEKKHEKVREVPLRGPSAILQTKDVVGKLKLSLDFTDLANNEEFFSLYIKIKTRKRSEIKQEIDDAILKLKCDPKNSLTWTLLEKVLDYPYLFPAPKKSYDDDIYGHKKAALISKIKFRSLILSYVEPFLLALCKHLKNTHYQKIKSFFSNTNPVLSTYKEESKKRADAFARFERSYEQNRAPLNFRPDEFLFNCKAWTEEDVDQLLSEIRRNLNETNEEIRKLAETLPESNPLIVKLKRESGEEAPPTFEELCALFIQNDRSAYLKKTYLNSAGVDTLHQKVGEALQLKVLEAHIKKTQTLLSDKKALKAHNQLGFEYDPTLHPEYLVYEALGEIRIRADQIENLERLDNDPYAVIHMIMGAGKSKVITPIWALLQAKKGKVPFIVVPASLYPTGKEDIRASIYNSFGKFGEGFEFSRESSMSQASLETLLIKLKKAKKDKGFFYTTKESLQAFLLKTYELYTDYDKETDWEKQNGILTQISLASQVLDFLKKESVSLFDEVHALLSCKEELNFTQGDKTAISQKEVDFIKDLIAKIAEKDELGLKENRQAQLSSTDYEAVVKPVLLDYASEKFPDIPLGYFTNELDEMPKGLESHPERNVIALMKEVTTHLLPLTLRKKRDEDFGLREGLDYAIPFVANETPSEKSEFASKYETLIYTLFYYLQKGIPEKKIEDVFESLVKLAKARMLACQCQLHETNINIEFLKKYQIHIDDPAALAQFKQQINSTHQTRVDFVAEYIAPFISTFSARLSANAQGAFNLFGSGQGMSGTPYNEQTFPHEMHTYADETIEQRSKAIINGLAPTAFIDLESTNENANYNAILEKIRTGNYQALIDCGSLIKGKTNEQVARDIFATLSPTGTLGVVFYDEKGELFVLERSGKVPFEKSTLTKEERFTFYDQRHTTGSDIKQADQAQALVTFSETTMEYMLFQSIWRMRGLETGQSFDLCASSGTFKMLGTDGTFNQRVLHFILENQKEKIKEDNFRAKKQEIRGIVLDAMNQALFSMSAKKQVSYLPYIRHLIQDSLDFDAFTLFGSINKHQRAMDLLEAHEKKWVDILKKLKKCGLIPNIEAHLAKIKKVKEKDVQLCETYLGRVNPAADAHVENEVEQEVEQEVELELQVQSANPFVRRYSGKYEWKNVSIYHKEPDVLDLFRSSSQIHSVSNLFKTPLLTKVIKKIKRIFQRIFDLFLLPDRFMVKSLWTLELKLFKNLSGVIFRNPNEKQEFNTQLEETFEDADVTLDRIASAPSDYSDRALASLQSIAPAPFSLNLSKKQLFHPSIFLSQNFLLPYNPFKLTNGPQKPISHVLVMEHPDKKIETMVLDAEDLEYFRAQIAQDPKGSKRKFCIYSLDLGVTHEGHQKIDFSDPVIKGNFLPQLTQIKFIAGSSSYKEDEIPYLQLFIRQNPRFLFSLFSSIKEQIKGPGESFAGSLLHETFKEEMKNEAPTLKERVSGKISFLIEKGKIRVSNIAKYFFMPKIPEIRI